MLTVDTPASQTALTTLDRVKAMLAITATDEDAYLEMLMDQVSRFVCDYLNVAMAEDGTKTLGRETLVETFMLRECRPLLQLSRAPVASITSIHEDDGDTALTADTDYQLTGASGFLRRVSESYPGVWSVRKVVVTYVAGWVLPGQTGANLPASIEAAVFDIIKNERDMRLRSAHVKAEEVPDVLRTEYFANIMNGPGGMPPETAAKLAAHVHVRP